MEVKYIMLLIFAIVLIILVIVALRGIIGGAFA